MFTLYESDAYRVMRDQVLLILEVQGTSEQMVLQDSDADLLESAIEALAAAQEDEPKLIELTDHLLSQYLGN